MALSKVVPTLEAFENVLNKQVDCLIENKGGRSFKLNVGDTQKIVKMKDLVHHFAVLSQNALKNSPNDADLKERITELANNIVLIDADGDHALQKASLWKRILTAIRRFFGNFGKSAHHTTLYTIFKKSSDLKPLTAEQLTLFKEFLKTAKIEKPLVDQAWTKSTDDLLPKDSALRGILKKVKKLDYSTRRVMCDKLVNKPKLLKIFGQYCRIQDRIFIFHSNQCRKQILKQLLNDDKNQG